MPVGWDGVGKMKRQGKGELNHEFRGPLWDDHRKDHCELEAFDGLVDQYSENPNSFAENWLQPLLAEGLTADGVLELLLHGATKPN
jgi:hypothetical protein